LKHVVPDAQRRTKGQTVEKGEKGRVKKKTRTAIVHRDCPDFVVAKTCPAHPSGPGKNRHESRKEEVYLFRKGM